MIAIQASARIQVFADVIPDNGINAGGFYCKVYGDTDREFEINDFTLSRNLFRGIKDESRKRAIVNSLVVDRVKAMYHK